MKPSRSLVVMLAPLAIFVASVVTLHLLTNQGGLILELLFNNPRLGSLLGQLLIIAYGYWLINMKWGDGKHGTNLLRIITLMVMLASVYFTIPYVKEATDSVTAGFLNLGADLWMWANESDLNRGILTFIIAGPIGALIIILLMKKFGTLGIVIGVIIILLFLLGWAKATRIGIGALPDQFRNVGAGGTLIDPPH